MFMVGKLENRRRGSWLLLILFAVGLACLVFAEAAESRASDGRYVATGWVRRHKGPAVSGHEDKTVAVDAQGNVFVAGTAESDNGVPEFLTIKYSPDGRKLWARRYRSSGSIGNYAAGLALDSQGNVYVTGSSLKAQVPYWQISSFATIKYDGNGQLLWEQFYDGPFSTGANWATAMALDGQGHVYVTGASYGSNGREYATIKYSPDGEELWVRPYSGPGTGDNYPWALAVDGQGNVCVTGESWGSGTGYDYATVKYNPEGEEIWVRRYNEPGNGYDYAYAIAADSQGNVYVTGASEGLTTIKYNPEGKRLWVRRSQPGGGANAIAVDAQGNVHVSGDSWGWGSGTGQDFAIIKYNSEGKRLWVRHYNGPGNSDDSATAMALDGQGNIYVTGYSVGVNLKADFATIKYSPDGRRLWVRRHASPDNSPETPRGIAVDGQGNVCVSGFIYESAGNKFLTIKYKQTP